MSVLLGNLSDKGGNCWGAIISTDFTTDWSTDFKRLQSYCWLSCMRAYVCVDETRASKLAGILWAAQGRTTGHMAAARWVSWGRHHTVCIHIRTRTYTHRHRQSSTGSKGHHLIDVVSELWGWTDGRYKHKHTHPMPQY